MLCLLPARCVLNHSGEDSTGLFLRNVWFLTREKYLLFQLPKPLMLNVVAAKLQETLKTLKSKKNYYIFSCTYVRMFVYLLLFSVLNPFRVNNLPSLSSVPRTDSYVRTSKCVRRSMKSTDYYYVRR